MNLKIKGMWVNVLMSFIHIILNLEKPKSSWTGKWTNKKGCVCAVVYYAAVNHWNTKDLRKHHAEWKKLDTMNVSHVIIPFVSKLSHQSQANL